jgi:hypothetical protein
MEQNISNVHSSDQRTYFHLFNDHCSCFLARASFFLLLVSFTLHLHLNHLADALIQSDLLVFVSLQYFDHGSLIHAASSEQLIWRCVCYLNSVKHLFRLQFLRVVTVMDLSSAVEVTLGLHFLWRSS